VPTSQLSRVEAHLEHVPVLSAVWKVPFKRLQHRVVYVLLRGVFIVRDRSVRHGQRQERLEVGSDKRAMARVFVW
jgi:hypothetical protein